MPVAILVAVAAVGAAAAVTFRNEVRAPAAHSVAVLPFDNLSSDPEQEFFADGITVETLNALSRVRDLRVTSRTSSFSFEGKGGDLRAVGEALGVAHVLQGSVRTAGDQVRITVQLSRARTGDPLWSETYERRLDDVRAIQLRAETQLVLLQLQDRGPDKRLLFRAALAKHRRQAGGKFGRDTDALHYLTLPAQFLEHAEQRHALHPDAGAHIRDPGLLRTAAGPLRCYNG